MHQQSWLYQQKLFYLNNLADELSISSMHVVELDLTQDTLPMQQLLIVAHGSRRAASNEEVKALAQKVAQRLQLPDENVQVAFLELALPSIQTALDQCFNQGCTRVTVLPYFLASGSHVTSDVPREIEAAQEKWPDKTIELLPHIGAAQSMVELIANSYN